MLYIALFLLLYSLAIIDLTTLKSSKASIYLIVVCILIIVSGIRWQTGTDWDSYSDFFQDIENYFNGTYINSIEIGYTYINYWVFQLFPNNYTALLFVNALLAIGIKAGFLRFNFKEGAFISLLFYFCYYIADITAVRQFVAISLCCLSVYFIQRNFFFIFLLFVLLASTIHISCVVFLLAFPIYHKRFSNKSLYSFLIISFLLGFFNLIDLFISKLSDYGPDLVFILNKLDRHSQNEEITNNTYLSYSLGTLKRAIVLPLFIWRKNYISQLYLKKYNGFLNLVIFGNLLYFTTYLSMPIFQRLTLPYLFFETLLWGFFVLSFKTFRYRLIVLLFATIYGALRLYLQINVYYEEFIPYKTIFDFL